MNVNQMHKKLSITHEVLAKAEKNGAMAKIRDRDTIISSQGVKSILEILEKTVHVNLGEVMESELELDRTVSAITHIQHGDLDQFGICFNPLPFDSMLLTCDLKTEEPDENLNRTHHLLVVSPEVFLARYPYLMELLPPEIKLGPAMIYILENMDGSPLQWDTLPMDVAGMLTKQGDKVDIFLGSLDKGTNIKESEIPHQSSFYYFSAGFLTYFLKLLSCKNVELRDTTPEKYKNKPQHKKPVGETWEIILRLPGKKVIYTGKDQKPTQEIKFLERAKHGTVSQRRGHFKTYTEERPLLGKHVGTWYWTPIFSSRLKDYKVVRTDK